MPFPLLAMIPALMSAAQEQQKQFKGAEGSKGGPDAGSDKPAPGEGGSPGSPGSLLGPQQSGGGAPPAGGPQSNPFDLQTAPDRAGADYGLARELMGGGGMPQGHMMGRVYAPPGMADYAMAIGPKILGMLLHKKGEGTLLQSGDTRVRTYDVEQQREEQRQAIEKADAALRDRQEAERTRALLDELRKGGGSNEMPPMSE